MYTGKIVKTYTQGQAIDVKVMVKYSFGIVDHERFDHLFVSVKC